MPRYKSCTAKMVKKLCVERQLHKEVVTASRTQAPFVLADERDREREGEGEKREESREEEGGGGGEGRK